MSSDEPHEVDTCGVIRDGSQCGVPETTLCTWRDTFAHVEVPGHRPFERVLENNVRDVASFPLLDGARDEWLRARTALP